MDHLKRFHPDLCRNNEPFSSSLSSQSSSTSGYNSVSRTNMKSVNSYFVRSIEYDDTSSRKKEIDRALARMIAVDYQPYNIVQNEGFRDFVFVLDPRYKLLSKDTLRNIHIRSMYNTAKEKLEALLDRVKYVGITCDSWQSATSEHYLTFTCHFIDKDFSLRSSVLSTRKLKDVTNHSSQNIATSLKEVFDEWSLNEKVTCIVTDNASSM